MQRIFLSGFLIANSLMLSCGEGSAATPKETGDGATYRNPVMAASTPDPTVIRAQDGTFYLYCTEDIRNIPIYRSTDMLQWNYVGTAFTNESRPNFEPGGGLWAPDINYINGKYVLYYSMSVWGGIETCGIGVAVADSPEGPFTDKGALFRSNTIGVKNSIDQFYFEDGGKKYIFWGSFCGIYGVELEDDGLSVKAGAEKVRIAGKQTETFDSHGTEGTYIHKRGKYYYLFGSTGTCCEGANSTYRVVVGRSENLFGPYLTKNGQSMFDNHYETVLQGNSVFAGPGHNAEIITDDEGNDWMPYHAYLKNDPQKGRVLCMDKIVWENDWPAVKGLAPSAESKIPFFTKSNPLPASFGDPFILKAADGKFYMYGTSEGIKGFNACSSDDLKNWKDEGSVYRGATPESWTVDCFWAPEVYERNGKYYLWFSANWKENPTGEEENFRIGVAVADKPTGPFREMYDRPVFDPGYPIIDANLLFDDATGKVYLYYSRCCYKHPVQSEVADWAKKQGWYSEIEESWVYGVELKPDFSGVVGEPQLLLSPPSTMDDPQAEWESRSVTSHEVNRRWTEGSFIFKNGDVYYIMYSANFFGGKNYAVGYATSNSPLGPFQKAANNPVLQKNTETGGTVTGTGHCMALTVNGERLCVYHARTEKTGNKRMAFIDKMEILPDGRLVVHGPTTKKINN